MGLFANAINKIQGLVAHDGVALGFPLRIGGVHRTTAPAVAAGDVVDLLTDAEGRLLVQTARIGASEIKTVRKTNASSTTVAEVLDPTTGTKVRIISILIDFEGTTSNGLEVYFAAGTNIGSTGGKEIAEAHQAAIGPVFLAWPDGAGPVGAVNDVISMRGTASVAEDVNLIVTFREE